MAVGSINSIVTLGHALEQLKVDPKVVEEIYFGTITQAGVVWSPTRQATLGVGMRYTDNTTTIAINAVCVSGGMKPSCSPRRASCPVHDRHCSRQYGEHETPCKRPCRERRGRKIQRFVFRVASGLLK